MCRSGEKLSTYDRSMNVMYFDDVIVSRLNGSLKFPKRTSELSNP